MGEMGDLLSLACAGDLLSLACACDVALESVRRGGGETEREREGATVSPGCRPSYLLDLRHQVDLAERRLDHPLLLLERDVVHVLLRDCARGRQRGRDRRVAATLAGVPKRSTENIIITTRMESGTPVGLHL